MNDYHQPEFYRFNEDSLELVKYVRGKLIRAQNILDAGAGCGVIGLELARVLKPSHLTLLEIQKEFEPSLDRNVTQNSSPQIDVEIVYSSFASWAPDKSYDLIVSNPPYYLPGHGESSASPERDIARTFKKDGWRSLLELTLKALTPQGRAFFVIKNNKVILKEVHHYLPTGLKISEDVQGQLIFLELLRLNKD